MAIPKELSDPLKDWATKVLVFAFGYATHKGKIWWELRHLRPVWAPFSDRADPIAVVLSTRPGPHFRSTPRISLSEMMSFSELSHTLKRLGRTVEPFSSDSDLDSLRNRDLIVVGGPSANSIAERLWRLLEGRVPVAFSQKDMRFVLGTTSYQPTYAQDTTVSKDYGLIVSTRSPLLSSDQNRLMLCFGFHGFGSRAAVSTTTQREFMTMVKKHVNGYEFAALVEVSVEKHTVLGCRTVECLPLLYK